MVIKGASYPREWLGWSGRAFVMVELVCTLWWASFNIPTINITGTLAPTTAIFTIKMELQTVYRHLQFIGSHKCVCHIWGRGLILCRTYHINCSSHTVVLYWSGLAGTPQRNKRGRKQTQTRSRPSVMAVNCPAAIFLCKWGRIEWKARGTNMEALPRKQNPTKGSVLFGSQGVGPSVHQLQNINVNVW